MCVFCKYYILDSRRWRAWGAVARELCPITNALLQNLLTDIGALAPTHGARQQTRSYKLFSDYARSYT